MGFSLNNLVNIVKIVYSEMLCIQYLQAYDTHIYSLISLRKRREKNVEVRHKCFKI